MNLRANPVEAAAAEWWRPAAPSPGPADARRGHRPRPALRAGSGLPFWGLLAFLFIQILAPQNLFPALAPLRIALLAGLASIAAYLLDCLWRGRPAGRRTPELSIAAGILAWAVATVPLSYWPGGSFAFLTGEYVKTLAVFWLLSRVVNTRPRLERLTWAITLMGLPLAITALAHFAAGEFTPVGPDQVKRIVGYDSGLTKNPNDLALMLNLMLPFAVAAAGGTRRWSLRVVSLTAILLYASAVVVTFSRAGFLTLGCAFLFYVTRLLARGRWLAGLGALALAVASTAFLPSGYLLRLATITRIDADVTGSAQIRSNDTLAALQIVMSRPLMGAGAGMNILALNDARGSSWLHVHNVYLEFAADLGLPGLALFLWLFGACLKDARLVRARTAGRADERVLFHVAQGAEVGLLAFGVAALFHPVAYDVYFYLVAGIAVSVRTVYEVEGDGHALGKREG